MPSVEQKVGHFLTHKVRRRNHLTPESLSYGPGPGPSSGAKRSAAEEAAEPRKEKMGLGGPGRVPPRVPCEKGKG